MTPNQPTRSPPNRKCRTCSPTKEAAIPLPMPSELCSWEAQEEVDKPQGLFQPSGPPIGLLTCSHALGGTHKGTVWLYKTRAARAATKDYGRAPLGVSPSVIFPFGSPLNPHPARGSPSPWLCPSRWKPCKAPPVALLPLTASPPGRGPRRVQPGTPQHSLGLLPYADTFAFHRRTRRGTIPFSAFSS